MQYKMFIALENVKESMQPELNELNKANEVLTYFFQKCAKN